MKVCQNNEVMTSPLKPWESHPLQNSTQMRAHSCLRDIPTNPRSAPVLPPLPRNSPLVSGTACSPFTPYSNGYNSLGYGGYGGYGSYGMPYRNSLFNSYGGYNNYNMFGMGGYPGDDSESRFIQYAEESSRQTFASVESIVRAFNSISMMLDNTFFAMTSSFRAVLSVAENFGRLRSMFGQIWYSINIFRLFTWLYRKLMWLLGRKPSSNSVSTAWKQAGGAPAAGGSNWPTVAFLGMLISAPYIISKFLPKYEDKTDPNTWKTPGIRAKAAFDFQARTANELSFQINDELMLAPTYIQEEMNLKNSGWALAVANGKSGMVPLSFLLINKSRDNVEDIGEAEMPIPRIFPNSTHKSHTKRVSFGENQIFENVDLEDYFNGKKTINLEENGSIDKQAPETNSESSAASKSTSN